MIERETIDTGLWRARCGESRTPGSEGGPRKRAGSKDRQRASVRPYVVLCHSWDEAFEVKARLAEWLAPRGLAFNEDKTRVVTLDEGFDFLGFNVRRCGDKLLIKPSKAAVRRIREQLRTELRPLRGTNARAVIMRLNPIIRGWAAYDRGVVSSKAFSALDDHMWTLTHKWVLLTHPNKPRSWIIPRYFDRFNQTRLDRWVFGDRESSAYLQKSAWTRIVRHYRVKSEASPDDPALTEYWAEQRRKTPPLSLDKAKLRLYESQHGRCSRCGDWLLPVDAQPQSPRECEQWLPAARKTIIQIATRADGTKDETEPRLTHAHCHARRNTNRGTRPALLSACEPSGLA